MTKRYAVSWGKQTQTVPRQTRSLLFEVWFLILRVVGHELEKVIHKWDTQNEAQDSLLPGNLWRHNLLIQNCSLYSPFSSHCSCNCLWWSWIRKTLLEWEMYPLNFTSLFAAALLFRSGTVSICICINSTGISIADWRPSSAAANTHKPIGMFSYQREIVLDVLRQKVASLPSLLRSMEKSSRHCAPVIFSHPIVIRSILRKGHSRTKITASVGQGQSKSVLAALLLQSGVLPCSVAAVPQQCFSGQVG